MHIIIPARYDSSRLPGKPLADVAGRPLIQRVHECACRTRAVSVIIATDDPRVHDAARAFGAEVCMTSPEHRSGTDRIAEVVRRYRLPDDDVVVNLQGDEPLMPPSLIEAVAQTLTASPDAVMATACHRITERGALLNPNFVKLVCDAQAYALYFSRAPIPWPRCTMTGAEEQQQIMAMRHIGLYAYRAGFVIRYSAWSPCPLEEIEQLEQLRVLWHGERIAVHVVDSAPEGGVDTPEDLERVRRYFSEQRGDD